MVGLLAIMITSTAAQGGLQQKMKNFMAMGAGLGVTTTATTTTTTTATTQNPVRPRTDDSDDFKIEDMSPKQQFILEGHLYTETLVGHITVRLRFNDLSARIDVTEKAAKRLAAGSRQRIQDMLPAWQATIDQLTEILNFFSVQREEVNEHEIPRARSFADDPDSIDVHNINALRRFIVKYDDDKTTTQRPRGRGVAGVLGGVLGLYNTVEGKSTHALAEANSKAIRKVMESVDAMREFGEKNAQRLDTTREEMMQVAQLNSKTALELYWDQTRDLIRAAGQVAMGATRQRLDPAILNIIDMENIWQGFMMKVAMDEWVPAFQHSQHLYQVRASFIGNTEEVKIQVHVPMRQAAATRWELLRFIPRPIYQEGVMITILPIKARLAVDPITHAYMELEQDTFESCNSIPGELYCPDTVRVVHTANTGSCLAAIWSENWQTIEETCWIQARKPTITAWAEGPNKFVVIAPTTLTVHVTCPHRPARAADVTGYKQIHLASGCVLTTEVFTLHAGNETMDERFHVEVDTTGSASMIRNATLNLETGERLAKLDRPMAVHSVAAEVKQILEDGKRWSFFGTKTWIAIGLATAALVGVTGFIGFLWCRIKFANTTMVEAGQLARDRIRRTLSRRPRWRPRTRQVAEAQDLEMSVRRTDSERGQEQETIAQFDGNDDVSDDDDFDPMQELAHRVNALTLTEDSRAEEDPLAGAFYTGKTTAWVEGFLTEVDIDQDVMCSYISTRQYRKLRSWWPWGQWPPQTFRYNWEDCMRWTMQAVIGIKYSDTRVSQRFFVTDDIKRGPEVVLGRDFLRATKRITLLAPGEYDFARRPTEEDKEEEPLVYTLEDQNVEQSLFTPWPDTSQTDGAYDGTEDWEPPEKIRRPDTPRPHIEVDDEGGIRRRSRGRGAERRERMAKAANWNRRWRSHWAEW